MPGHSALIAVCRSQVTLSPPHRCLRRFGWPLFCSILVVCGPIQKLVTNLRIQNILQTHAASRPPRPAAQYWQGRLWAFGVAVFFVACLPFYDDVDYLLIHLGLVAATQAITAFGFYRRVGLLERLFQIRGVLWHQPSGKRFTHLFAQAEK
ncbi:hypothetical protein MTO96_022684 [Rhipicephalus appendiculatus]